MTINDIKKKQTDCVYTLIDNDTNHTIKQISFNSLRDLVDYVFEQESITDLSQSRDLLADVQLVYELNRGNYTICYGD